MKVTCWLCSASGIEHISWLIWKILMGSAHMTDGFRGLVSITDLHLLPSTGTEGSPGHPSWCVFIVLCPQEVESCWGLCSPNSPAAWCFPFRLERIAERSCSAVRPKGIQCPPTGTMSGHPFTSRTPGLVERKAPSSLSDHQVVWASLVFDDATNEFQTRLSSRQRLNGALPPPVATLWMRL